MKKWILAIGIVLLLIGVALYGYEGLEKPGITMNKFTYNNGKYISGNMSVKTNNYIISVKNPSSDSGLVPARDVKYINNETELVKYMCPTDYSFGNIKEYKNITPGAYAFVEFAGYNHDTSITYGPFGSLVYIGYAGDFGAFLIVIGIIVMIPGIVLRKDYKIKNFL